MQSESSSDIHRAAAHALRFALSILPLLAGCGATSAVWENAGTDQLSLYRVNGVRTPPDGRAGELLVSYSVQYDGRGQTLFAVPLDERGAPPDLFILALRESR